MVGQVEEEISAHAGSTVAAILVDPGDVRDPDLLLDRVAARVGEPVPLGEGNLFGMVLGGVDDGGAESAARRTLAAGSLGAGETRVGRRSTPATQPPPRTCSWRPAGRSKPLSKSGARAPSSSRAETLPRETTAQLGSEAPSSAAPKEACS